MTILLVLEVDLLKARSRNLYATHDSVTQAKEQIVTVLARKNSIQSSPRLLGALVIFGLELLDNIFGKFFPMNNIFEI